MDDVWAARDTTPEAIDSALRRLLTQRRHEYEDHVPATLRFVPARDPVHDGDPPPF